MTHARRGYVAAAIATIAAGLLVHRQGAMLGPTTQDVLGDALWGTMMAWSVGALALEAIAVGTSPER